jgi:hypothetical protein
MPSFPPLQFSSKVHGPLKVPLRATPQGIFVATVSLPGDVKGKPFDAPTLAEVEKKVKAYLAEVDRDIKVFPVIAVEEISVFGNSTFPIAGFEYRRFWLSDHGWKSSNWIEPTWTPEFQETAKDDYRFKLSPWDAECAAERGVEGFVRTHLRQTYGETWPADVLAQKFPVTEGQTRGGVVYLVYTRELYEALGVLTEKIRSLREALFALFGNPDQVIHIANTWQDLVLEDKKG